MQSIPNRASRQKCLQRPRVSKMDPLRKGLMYISITCTCTILTETLQYRPTKFVILEALSATGLRAIRYAKEIPHVK